MLNADSMNDSAPQKSAVSVAGVLLVCAGVLFMALWIGVHLVWASMSLMGSLMANDSGRATDGAQMVLIFGMLAGQVLAGGAGIPAGLAFFLRGRRKLLLGLFAALFVAGALLQAGAF